MQRSTKLLQLDGLIDDPANATSPPIYQCATFAKSHTDEHNIYDYSRSGNPTRDMVEKKLSILEESKYAYLVNSGVTAIHLIFELLRAGDHIIVGDDLYGGTYRLLGLLANKNITVSFIDVTDVNQIIKTILTNTRLIFVETPSNPLQKIVNLPQLSQLAKQHNTMLVVDNSLLSSWYQQPLNFGADIVIYSATKHFVGHSDVTAGVICTNNEAIAEKIKFLQNSLGVALPAFDSWLLFRGLKTLPIRLRAQQENTLQIVEYLQTEPMIKHIYYCGLKTHCGYLIHNSQSSGYGSVLAIDTNNEGISHRIVNGVSLFKLAVSFGNLSSFISIPVKMSHFSIPKGKQLIPSSLIRLSVGIEDANDLIDDLKQAIRQAKT